MSAAAPAPAAKPFHVLLLAGGSKKRPRDPDGAADDAQEVDDYLSRRAAFRKQRALRGGAANDASSGGAGNGGVGEGVRGAVDELHRLASRLELAMAACCERAPPPHEAQDVFGGPSSPTSAAQHHSRSRLHRPLFPSNYVAPDPSAEPDSPVSSSPAKTEAPEADKGPTKAGALRSGKEGHFAKLLFLYVPQRSVGHRALAVAILQRTVDWEASFNNTSNNNADGNIRGGERYPRTKAFLAAGGMKLLARWLVDAYTSVPASSSKGHVVASPTGRSLLPLLRLLHALPFDKEIVVAAGIHKSIKKLKKALGRLGEGVESEALERATHPIAGGGSVGKALAATERVMESWNEASKVKSNGEDVRETYDPLRRIREKVLGRFEELTRYQCEGGEAPEWMPQSIVSMRALRVGQMAMHQSPSPPSKTGEGTGMKESPPLPNDILARPGQNKRTMDGIFDPRKRRVQLAALVGGNDNNKNNETGGPKLGPSPTSSSKKVSWTDRPKGSAMPRPLREERVFVKDVEEAPGATGGAGTRDAVEIPDELLADNETAEEVEIPDELFADAEAREEIEIPDEMLADPEPAEEVEIPDEMLADPEELEDDDSDDGIMEDLF